MSRIVSPGGSIGCLGGGQLGAMLGREARKMGYSFHVFTPSPGSPASRVADSETLAPFDDTLALARFADRVDVVTLEFENVPEAAVRHLSARVPVRPGAKVLGIAQNRLREKDFLSGHGFPVVPYAAATSADQLDQALDQIGLPAVVKTVSNGYDGHGQWRFSSKSDRQVPKINRFPVVVEQLVDLACEISVITARNGHGQQVTYPPFLNTHRNHILDLTVAPAGIPESISRQAGELAEAIADQLDLWGLICVEFFVTTQGRLLVNELAPRPHNSGHLTLEAHLTNQFEQQLRAICGLPLGRVDLRQAAAMANLLGDLWEESPPAFEQILEVPGLYLHLYGKESARSGRKMGHITALGSTVEEAAERVRYARNSLNPRVTQREPILRAG